MRTTSPQPDLVRPVRAIETAEETDMNNDAKNGSLLKTLFIRLGAAIGRWRCSWQAAVTAADAYDATRSKGASHEVASKAAFTALTGDQHPLLPDRADTAQTLQTEPAHRPDGEGRRAGWAAPQSTC